jgi:BASS family bile acid:Na+ symporter
MRIKASAQFIARQLSNRNVILSLAIVLGFILPSFARYTQELVIPALAVAMMLSVSRDNPREIFIPRTMVKPVLAVVFFSFLLLGGINVLAGTFFAQDTMLRAGFIILAALPPAIAVIPFSYTLGADVKFSLIAVSTGFLASVVIMPLMVGAFLGGEFNPATLFITLAEIIVLPIIAAQLMRLSGIVKHTEKYHATVINWCFFIVTFSVVGDNRDLILNSPQLLLPAACTAFISIFLLGQIISFTARRLEQAESEP